uniref:PAS domain-containing protein n=1 Tax=Panagrellus redivivus TaxID=6233 RepID=A0A7E4VUG9_PANRE
MSLLPHFVLDDPYLSAAVITMDFIKTLFGMQPTPANASGTSFKTIPNDSAALASSTTISSDDSDFIHVPPRLDSASTDSANYDRAAISYCIEAEKHFAIPFCDDIDDPKFDPIEGIIEQEKFFLENSPVDGHHLCRFLATTNTTSLLGYVTATEQIPGHAILDVQALIPGFFRQTDRRFSVPFVCSVIDSDQLLGLAHA